MRTIKFKFYSKHKENGNISVFKTSLEEIENNDSWQGASPWIRIAVCQFTGLKDKNGKEIYEGDILKNITLSGEWQSIVEWKSYCYAGVNSDDKEIIGNIYENPELLRETKKE